MLSKCEKRILTDESFFQAINSHGQFISVSFIAEWSAVCRLFEITLEEVIKEHDVKFSAFKMDIDDNSKTTQTYAIHELPTTLLFKSGELVEKIAGLISTKEFLSLVQTHFQTPKT